MKTSKLVKARRNADHARRVKNEWHKQFIEMRRQRDNAQALIEKIGRNLDAAKQRLAEIEASGPVAKVVRNLSGQTSIFDPNGDMFDATKYVGEVFYTTPQPTPTVQAAVAAALRKAAEVCMRATPDRALVRVIGESAHYVACSEAVLSLPHDDTALRELIEDVISMVCISAVVDNETGFITADHEEIVNRVLKGE